MMHMQPAKVRLRIPVVLPALLLTLCCLWGGTGGGISGTVTDPKDAAVVNARVTVINLDNNISQTVATNLGGVYFFPDLMVGTYDIQVEAPGFRIYRRTNVVLDANAILHVDVALSD